MRITMCDNCKTELKKEENTISFYKPTIFTITEEEGISPYKHNITFYGEEKKNLVKHFCSESCIGEYYAEAKERAKSLEATLKKLKEEESKIKTSRGV